MRKWTWRKFWIHAALSSNNPLGSFVADEFHYQVTCGQLLWLFAKWELEDKKR